MTTGSPTPMKTQIEAASWARKLANSKNRQWAQVQVFLDDLVPLMNDLSGIEVDPPDLSDLGLHLDSLEALAGLGLVVTPDQVAEMRAAADVLLGGLDSIDADQVAEAVAQHEALADALTDRDSALEETGPDRADALSAAWDEVVASLELLADALEALEPTS